MKKRFLSLLCVLALCLGLLPVTALAATGAPSMLYVGNQQVMSGSKITYWTTDEDGELTQSTDNQSWNVKYDPITATLTLKGAKISGSYHQYNNPYTAGIYAQGSSAQSVALTIDLIGENTITGDMGIYVNAEASATSYGTDASLTITSENNGSLQVSGLNYGIYVKSGTGNASLTINDASVVAKTTQTYSGYAGVYVQSSMNATNSPQLSLKVDGGSLTASGGTSGDGIQFYVGNLSASATTSLTVSGNAIVRAENGIKAGSVDKPTPSGTGIVFDGTEGTVYGNVDLQDDLTINQGETLTVPDGSSLNCNGKLTNNGTILASGGTVSGNLSGGTAVTTPNITAQPTGQTVTEGGNVKFSVTASADNSNLTYQWQQSTDKGSSWTDISDATEANYTISSTTTSMSDNQYRCVVTSASGVSVISQAATLTVTPTNNYFEISTAEQLRDFANAVNEGYTTANAVLTADITLTDANWTPIGKENACMYEGIFDGQGHTISGLQCSVTSGDVAGLFGVIGSSGVVKNVGIANSNVAVVVTATDKLVYAGGLCGHNAGTIENCWNSGNVSASSNGSDTTSGAYAGGLCGWNYGIIRNCWNSGAVKAESTIVSIAGGLCGHNAGTIENCWNSGNVSDTSSFVGGVCGVTSSASNITNSYWLAGAADYGIGNPYGNTNAESKTADEFASGEVAWLLNQGQTGTPWGQGSNNMPVLKGNLPAGVTAKTPIQIKIIMTDNSVQYRYTTKGSTLASYPTGYAFVFKDGDTKTWINKGTQTYDSDTTIYAENMTLEKIPEKAATCTENGNSEYWYCAAFDKYFSDENGINEISAESTIVKASGHSYGEPTWEWANDNSAKAIFTCKKGDDTQTLSGIMASKITKDATCDAKGIRTYTAKVTFNGKEYSASKEVDIPALSCNASSGNDQTYDDGGPFTRNECGDVFDRWGNLIYDAPDCVVNSKPITSPSTTKPQTTTETTLEPIKTAEPTATVEAEETTTPKPSVETTKSPETDVKVEKENSFGFVWWILGGIGAVIVGIVVYLIIKNKEE